MSLETKTAAVAAYARSVDFGRVTLDYERYRPGPPDTLYDRIDALHRLQDAQAIDVGAGTGAGAIAFARRGARVTAIDPAQDQLVALARAATAHSLTIQTRPARAEETGLPDHSIDLYLALQCWHWFDRPRAAQEAMRILRPGGLIVCASFDYLPHRSELARATEELILRHNPNWPMSGGHGVHINPLNDLPNAGFVSVEQFSFEHPQPFNHEEWRGRMRTCNGVGASLDAARVASFDADLAAMLQARFPDTPIHVPHRVWAVTARRP
ncbi:MAG: class I SAM-dependent methyltransferase [Phycisphaeraceae bacterium]|nr:MAG: class I SAM-dependent methyltransferase [Phycisphaeraceae bacterium]